MTKRAKCANFAPVLLIAGCAVVHEPSTPPTPPKAATIFLMGNIIFDSTVTNEPPAIVTGNAIDADETTKDEQ